MKWNFLLRAGGISLSQFETLRVSTIGLFFGAWTPAQLGSDVYRTMSLRGVADSATVISSQIIERYANWLSLALLAIFGLPWTIPWLSQQSQWALFAFGFVTVAVLAIGAIGMRRQNCQPETKGSRTHSPGSRATRLRSSLQRASHKCVDALAQFRSSPGTLFLFLCLTLVEVLGNIAINGLVIRSLGSFVSMGYLFLAMPVVYILVRLPITVQGIGIQESAFGLVMVNAGLPVELGIAVSLVHRIIEWLTSIIPGAVAFCLTRKTLRRVAPSANVEH